MKCIKCVGEWIPTTLGPVTLDRCDLCGGIWFDGQELSRIIAHVRAGGAPPGVERTTPHDKDAAACPRCGTELECQPLLSIDDVHYDKCPQGHGVWLDGGELNKITADPKAAAEADFFTRR